MDPLRRILPETGSEPALQYGWQPVGECVPIRLETNHRTDGFGRLAPPEWPPAGQHFVEDAAERPDVGALINRPSQRLFGAHVCCRAHHPIRRHRDGVVMRHGAGGGGREGLGQAEVEDLDRAVGSQLDVRGLQIPMNDALFVGGFESAGDLARQQQGFGGRNWPLRDPVRERWAFDQLQHQRLDDIVVFHPMDRADVGVIQRRKDLCLALESREPASIRGEALRQDFEGDAAAEPGVASRIHLAHPTNAYELEDII